MERDGGRERDRSGARARRSRTPNARLRVELHIGALVIDDLGTGSPDALVAAMTAELQAALSRELAVLGQVDGQARAAELVAGLSADRVRAAVTLPPAGAAGGAGRVIGASVAGAVAGRRASAGQPGGAR